jgi:hypothetical protein
MIHLVGHTQNDLPVYVDLSGSGAAKHISREPHLLTLAAEVLSSISPDKPAIRLDHDMGRNVGYDFVVKTTATDTIFYAQLVQDDIYTRFTKNGRPLATRHVSIILEQHDTDTSYIMNDIWIGRLTPPRPNSAEETAESKAYWEDHATVFDSQAIQTRTLTKTRPY